MIETDIYLEYDLSSDADVMALGERVGKSFNEVLMPIGHAITGDKERLLFFSACIGATLGCMGAACGATATGVVLEFQKTAIEKAQTDWQKH